MRGKNILWISLIAMLLSVMMMNFGIAPAEKTELYVTPTRLPETAQGHVGDEYWVSIEVANVVDLYAIGFTVKFAPYVKTLVASDVAEGEFLKRGGTPTYFAKTIDAFAGEVKVGISRLGAVAGESGSGTILTLKMTVAEAGESPIDIVDEYLLDSNLNPIDHVMFGSNYYGSTGDLVKCNMPDGRSIISGTSADFTITVRNDADVPLAMRARIEIARQHDDRRIKLYAGQTYYGGYLGADPPSTYLYVDGYTEDFTDWAVWGSSPYLDAVGDGNLVNSTTNADLTGMYTFEDIDFPYLGIYNVVSNVDFFGYTKCAGTGPDVDPYCFTTSEGVDYSWMWCDSMGGTTDWAWTGLRYYKNVYDFPEYYGFPHTHDAVNNMKLALENYGADPNMQCDALRAIVEFATIVPVTEPIFEVPPGGTTKLDPVTWVAVDDHIGKYDATVIVEYSELYPDVGFHWKNTGAKVKTFHFWVVPAI